MFVYCKEESGIEVMQFTGLKDRNGVEIFEDDILRCDYEGMFEEITVEGIVEIRSFHLWLDFPNKGQSVGLEAFDEESIEVIGNVWEHPELLEGK